MSSLKILVLYAEVMGYTTASLNALVRNYGAEVHLVSWGRDGLTPFRPPRMDGVTFYSQRDFSERGLRELATGLRPSACYVSGWTNRGYNNAARALRKGGVPVLVGVDNQWSGTWRQKAACLLSPWKVKPFFSHIFVPGVRQYEFARKLGYQDDRILMDLYSADVDLFRLAHSGRTEWKRRVLFVGRFAEEKGIGNLCDAFGRLREGFPGWELVLVGNGPLRETVTGKPGITVKDFMPPEEVVEEARQCSIFCLPSTFEPWGVVIHEFAAAGLPLVTSDACGANAEFVVHGYNGYIFQAGRPESLAHCLKKLMESRIEVLERMGGRSRALSLRVTPDIWAARVMSAVAPAT